MDDVDAVRRFVEESFLDGPANGGDPLEGLELDSLGVEQIVDFLEERYGVSFEDDELAPEDFGSLAAVAALVDAKLAPGTT